MIPPTGNIHRVVGSNQPLRAARPPGWCSIWGIRSVLVTLPGADRPVLGASVGGQAVAIKEVRVEGLRIGREFQGVSVVSMVLA